MKEMVINAINEYKEIRKIEDINERGKQETLYSRKIHMACNMGLITREELDEIKNMASQTRLEEVHEYLKNQEYLKFLAK